MPQEILNVGSAANDGTGDSTRDAWVKTKANFAELYTGAPSEEARIVNEIAGYGYGSTIFVDSVNGSDSNTGLSFDSPLASLVHVQNLAVDGINRIAIKRGSSFRTPMTIASATFSAAKPLGIVAYGVGNAPILSGGVVQDGPWSLVTGTEYSVAANAATATAGAGVPAYHIADDGTITRLNRGTASSLATNEWDLDSGNVHVNIGAAVTGTIEIPLYVPVVVSTSHVFLHGINTRFSGNDGVSVTGTPDNITIANCVSHWNANDGINVFTGGTNVRAVGCTLSDNGRTNDGAGDGFSGHTVSTGVIHGCVIERNCKDGVTHSAPGTWRICGNRLRGHSQGIVI